jgi:hypothetical protein
MLKRIKGWFVKEPVVEPRVVEAVFSSDGNKNRATAKAVEQAMAQAVMDYLARGGSMADVPALIDVQLQARNRVLGRN